MPKTLSVREDLILQRIPALVIALGINPGGSDEDLTTQVRTLQANRTTLIYDHNDKTVTADGGDGPIRMRIC